MYWLLQPEHQAFLLSHFCILIEFIDSTEQLEEFDLEEDFEILSI